MVAVRSRMYRSTPPPFAAVTCSIAGCASVATSGDPFQPEAASAVIRAGGVVQRRAQSFGVRVVRIARTEEHLEARAEHEQRADEILLVPAAILVQHPRPRVLDRQKDIVEVDPDARAQA